MQYLVIRDVFVYVRVRRVCVCACSELFLLVKEKRYDHLEW